MDENWEIEKHKFDGETRLSISVNNKLNASDLNKIEDLVAKNSIVYISFKTEQTTKLWKEINRIIVARSPAIRFAISNLKIGEFENLSFLENLPDIQDLYISNYYKLKDLSPISNLKKLRVLRLLYPFRSARVRLKPLTELKQLEEFEIFHVKDIEEIANFTSLKKITLLRLKCDNLDFLKPLINLEGIRLGASDKITDFSGLYDLPRLKDGFFIKDYKNTTAEFISHLKKMEKLKVYDFNSLVEFPSLENLDNLTELEIVNLKILKNIDGVAKAKNLKELIAYVGKEFKPSALKILKGHPSLQTLRAGFHTNKQKAEFELIKKEILG